MGCGCNKGAQTMEYVYTAPNGSTTVYSKEVQAQAQKIRNGGSYVSRPKQ